MKLTISKELNLIQLQKGDDTMKKLSKSDLSKMIPSGSTNFQIISNEMRSSVQQSKMKEFVEESRKQLASNHSLALVMITSPGVIVGPE